MRRLAVCRSSPSRTGFVRGRRPSCLTGDDPAETTSSLASAAADVPGRSQLFASSIAPAQSPVPTVYSDRLLATGLAIAGLLATTAGARDGDRNEHHLPESMVELIEEQTLAAIVRRNTWIRSELPDDLWRVR
jgi:hypothetical protein